MRGGGATSLKKIKQANHSLVFYSEGKQYHNVFKPILAYLDSISYPYTYLTSSKEDFSLFTNSKDFNTSYTNANSHFEYIGSSDSNKAITRLNSLRADIVMMSTPQLHVLQIKRSKGVRHYCHIIHSLPHIDTYEIFALDYFDSVFTNSDIHTDFIRKVEKVRGLPQKQITITGCTYLDVLQTKLKNYQQLDKDKKINFFEINHSNDNSSQKRYTILLAPSWGREALLNKYGMNLIKPFMDSKFNLIIRPHPQSYTSESTLLESLKEQTKDCKNIVWDSNTDNIYALDYADMMIGDFSGVLFDFVCLFEKPVLTPTFNFNIAGYDLEDIYDTPWVKSALAKIGQSIKPSDFDKIPEIVTSILQNKSKLKELQENIKEMKENLWRYQGIGGIKSAQEILKIQRDILIEKIQDKLTLHNHINTIENTLKTIEITYKNINESNTDSKALTTIQHNL